MGHAGGLQVPVRRAELRGGRRPERGLPQGHRQGHPEDSAGAQAGQRVRAERLPPQNSRRVLQAPSGGRVLPGHELCGGPLPADHDVRGRRRQRRLENVGTGERVLLVLRRPVRQGAQEILHGGHLGGPGRPARLAAAARGEVSDGGHADGQPWRFAGLCQLLLAALLLCERPPLDDAAKNVGRAALSRPPRRRVRGGLLPALQVHPRPGRHPLQVAHPVQRPDAAHRAAPVHARPVL